jgi:hypothetical protein
MKSSKQMSLEQQIPMNTSVYIDDDLQRKLELYEILSNHILEMNNQKSDLDKLLAKQEIPEEIIVKNKSELSSQIIEKNKELYILIDSMAELIMTASSPFLYLSKLDRGLADEIACIISRNYYLNKNSKSPLIKEIASLYDLDQTNFIIEEKKEGKQDGFIINDKQTGLKLFIKTTKILADDSIDPRELFVYKVLEYMELGPETRFNFTADSSNPGGHIVTKDVGYSNNEDITNIFFTDNFITEEDPNIDTLAHWENSLNNGEFRVKFLTLSIVNDLLHLNDTFATNAFNYGSLIQKSKTTAPQYKAFLIDHQVKNSLFKYQPDKNPVISLIEKLKRNSKNNLTRELISYKIIKDNSCFVHPEKIKSELLEAISAVSKKFPEVVKTTNNGIKGIMSKFTESFSETANSKLEEYLVQTLRNIEKFDEIKDSYTSNIEEISKDVIKLLNNNLQFKGENITTENGLYLKDIEYNLQIIKNEDKFDSIFDKVVTVNYLYSCLEQNQYLYVINPEGINSRFNDHLLNYRNSKVSIFNASVQKDNSTCADHSLFLLKNVVTNNRNDLDLCMIGMVIVSNNHGNHANLFMISTNPYLGRIIESNIASYKISLGLNHIDYSTISSEVNLNLFYKVNLDDDTTI